MESSFLEDFLQREVDQNKVNALVGSLESQLTSSGTTAAQVNAIKTVSADKITSISQLVSQSIARSGTNLPKGKSSPNLNSTNVLTGTQTNIPQTNGQINNSIKIVPNNIGANTNSPRGNLVTGKSSTPPPRSLGLSNSPVTPSTASSQVPIRPKLPSASSATVVPIAPRISNIMITPRQTNILMAPRGYGPGATLIQNSLVARMPPGVVPRMEGLTSIALPPSMASQIRGVSNMGHAITMSSDQSKNIGKPNPMQMNTPVTATLTRIKPSNSNVPGQVTYRFRPVNPASSVHTSNLSSNLAGQQQANASAASFNMMKESVKRLKEFFHNLINLACGPGQPPEIGKMVKELVHNLMVREYSVF